MVRNSRKIFSKELHKLFSSKKMESTHIFNSVQTKMTYLTKNTVANEDWNSCKDEGLSTYFHLPVQIEDNVNIKKYK